MKNHFTPNETITRCHWCGELPNTDATGSYVIKHRCNEMIGATINKPRQPHYDPFPRTHSTWRARWFVNTGNLPPDNMLRLVADYKGTNDNMKRKQNYEAHTNTT